MKNLAKLVFTLCLVASGVNAQQDTWTQLQDVNGAPKSACIGFALNGDGYLGLGLDEYFERRKMYAYDVSSDDWSGREELGGSTGSGFERSSAVAFSIGNKAFVGLGTSTGDPNFLDFWEYNPSSDSWAQIANFEGTARRQAVGFTIGQFGYVGTGQDTNGDLKKDFWKYDPNTNAWTAIADFGGSGRQSAVGFAMGGFGYVGTGDDGKPVNDFWKYDPLTDQWTQKAAFPGSARAGAVGWGIQPQGFIATGYDINLQYMKDVWEYNADDDTWMQRGNFSGDARTKAVAFVIGNLAYLGTGYDDNYLDDFWSYEKTILTSNVGLNEIVATASIFPNPSSSNFTIELDKQVDAPVLEIYNGLGQKVTGRFSINETPSNGTSFDVDGSRISAGNYLFVIYSNGEPVTNGKIAIR
jgi:N-acetylneuraminic acid mutarotase